MYYGNSDCGSQESPEDVWDSGFVMVQHLFDDTSSSTSDSTLNGNDGLKKAADEPVETSSGKIYWAQDFDGSDDYIGVADNDGLDHGDGEGFTYMAWIKSDLFSSYRAIVTHRDTGSSAIVGLWALNNNYLHSEVYNDGRTSKASGDIGVSLSTDVWYYVGLTRSDAGAVEVWFNGSSYNLGTCIGDITPSEDLFIGRHSSSGTQFFDGIIDEVRLSNMRRSDAWIETCFNNQRDPGSFHIIGVEVERTLEEPVISDEQPVNGSSGVDFNPLLQANVSDDQGDSVDWYILSNASGAWSVLDNGILSDGNGTVSATSTNMDEYGTIYYWSVNASDGVHWTNNTYHFTTELNVPPEIINENPINNSVDVSRWPACNVTVFDENDNELTVYFYEDTTGDWIIQQINTSVPSGSNVVWSNYSNASSYYTTYNWAVHVSDGVHWTNNTYHFTTEFTPSTWWNTDWHIRKEITINHSMVSSTLSNFPILFRTVDTDLSFYAQNNGEDIVFTDYSGNKLSHQIEYYNDTTGELVCWVNVTSLSSDADTLLYMYYGNADCSSQQNSYGVWDSSHRLVYHLDETTGTHYDSTVYGNDGSPSGGLNQDVVGLIDGADEFDGINSQITTSDDDSLDFGENSFTISAWINLTKTSTYQAIAQKRDGANQGFYFDIRSNGLIEAKIEDITTASITGILTTSDVCTANWRYIAGVFDRSSNKMVGYVDGIKELEVDISSITDTINTSTDLHVGYYDSAFPANGIIDELRVSEKRLSDDWINTSYMNQRDPSSFYSIGIKETYGTGIPIVSDESPLNNSEQVAFNPLLQARITDYEDDDVDWYILSNYSGSWSVIDSGTLSGGNGLISSTPTNMDSYDTTYYWSVNVTDPGGSGKWTNKTYCFTTIFAPGPWWNNNWLYRKLISIYDEEVVADSDLTNFPVLISIIDSNLSDHAQFDGDDFVFTDYDGNRLNHEIEFYDGNLGELVAWVNVTTLDCDENTKLYLYYGNNDCGNQEHISDVWDLNYRMVQHLPHNWIPYEGNPISAPGTTMQWHSVFKVDDTYYAYYHGSNQINRATSPDGKTWTDDTANNPVLPPSASGWDATIGVPWAFYENGTYYILYYGYNGTNAVGLATSSDGINFVKYPNNESPQQVISNAEPWGVMKINDTYYEYYVQNSGPGGRCVCLATSTDLVNWTKDPNNPIFSLGLEDLGNGCFNADVFKYGSYYYILIPHYTSGSDYARIELYRDTNPTFYPEDREHMGPVKPVSHVNTWEQTDQDTPAVLTDTVFRDTFNDSNQELWMYYNGCCSRKQGLTISPNIPQALKGGMRDSTTYSNHGVSAGVGGPIPQFSIVGGGINIDSDEYMVISHNDSLNITDELMISVWLKLDDPLASHISSDPGIIDKKEGDSGYGLWFNKTENDLVFYIGTGTSNYIYTDVSSYDLTQWHHIAACYDGSNANIYIDSNLEHSESLTGTIGNNNMDVWIGDLVHLSGNNLIGSIDEVCISNILRGNDWINTSYNNQFDPDSFFDVGTEENAPGESIPPEIKNVTASPDPQIIGGYVNITCDVSDNMGVDVVKVDITYPDSSSENLTMNGNYFKNQTYLQTGLYSYFIWASDTSNNINMSGVYYFYIYDPNKMYVDDDYDDSTPGWQIDRFDDIQDGIDNVSSYGIVSVSAGLYNKDLSISSLKAGIELVGEDKNTTVIKGVQELDWPNHSPAISILASGVKIHGFTIESPDYSRTDGNPHSSGITVGSSDVEIFDNRFNATDDGTGNSLGWATLIESYGAWAGDISGLYIHNNTFTSDTGTDKGSEGVYINYNSDIPNPVGTIIIENNVFEGQLFRGITSERSKTIIAGNIIGSSYPPNPAFNAALRGIDISSPSANLNPNHYNVSIVNNTVIGYWQGIKLGGTDNNLDNITILQNVLQLNTYGAKAYSSANGIVINYNKIIDNTLFGVENADTGNQLDATYNWWGDASGPYHVVLNPGGLGDNVSDYVSFGPWYVDSGMTTLSTPLIVFVDDDFTSSTPGWGYDHFDSVQDGIDAVLDNGIVQVADGSYTEQVRINKSVTVSGESRSGVVIDPDGLEFEGPRVGDDKVRSAVVFESGSSGAVLRNLTVENDYASDLNYISGIEVLDGGIDDVYVNNVSVSGVSGRGFGSYHTDYTWPPPDGWVVENCSFSTSDTGTWSGMCPENMKDLIIQDCDVGPTNYGGILLINSNNSVVQRCVVHDTVRAGIQVDSYCTGAIDVLDNEVWSTNSAHGSDYGDVRFYGQHLPDPHGDVPAVVTVSGNVLRDGFNGLCVRSGEDISTRTIAVNENNIFNHSNYGALNSGTGVLDATYNWWGDASGPGGVGPGTGDNVSVNVDFAPWYDAVYPGGNLTSAPPEISNMVITNSIPKDIDPVYGWENITATVTDDVEVGEVRINITYPDMHTENISMINAGGGVYYYNTTFTSVGSYSYFIWAIDTNNIGKVSGVNSYTKPPNWDITMDGICNILDVSNISYNWLKTGAHGWIRADIDNNGVVNLLDVSVISLYWQHTWS